LHHSDFPQVLFIFRIFPQLSKLFRKFGFRSFQQNFPQAQKTKKLQSSGDEWWKKAQNPQQQ
jgi:hypothetical protein